MWIGAYATILGGVRIGNGAVIGAGAVVAKDVPPYAVVVGNPARIVRYRFDQDTIDWLQQLRWWNWTPEQIRQRLRDFDDVPLFREKYPTEIQDFAVGEPCGDLSKALAQSKREGYIFYYFQPDVLSKEAVWKEVLRTFTRGSAKDLKKILFVDIYQDVPLHIKAQFVKLISTYKSGQILLNESIDGYDVRTVLPFMDFIITTKEPEVSTVIDLASNCKCEIVYGFDDF